MNEFEVQATIFDLLSKTAKEKRIDLTVQTKILVDIDLDSMSMVEFLLELQHRWGHALINDPETFAHLSTIESLAKYIVLKSSHVVGGVLPESRAFSSGEESSA